MGRITIRLSDTDELALKVNAKKEKVTVAEYVRRSISHPLTMDGSLRLEGLISSYREDIDTLLDVIKMIILQQRISNSLQVEILRRLAPDDADEIIKSVKEYYGKEVDVK